MIHYEKLRKRMKEEGITYNQLRRDAGLNYKVIRSLKQDQSITITSLDKICQAMEVQPGELMEWVPGDQVTIQSRMDHIQKSISKLEEEYRHLQKKLEEL